MIAVATIGAGVGAGIYAIAIPLAIGLAVWPVSVAIGVVGRWLK